MFYPRFIIGIEGLTLNAADMVRLKNPHVVGVILFTRNFIDSTQLKALTRSIKNVRHDLLISADQEGGRVQRFRTDGFTELPSLYDLSQSNCPKSIKEHVATLALELKSHGVDYSFTPIVDLYHPQSRVINKRAFSNDPQQVVTLATQYINLMHQYKLTSVLKHFPGHGSLIADSHFEIVVDMRNLIDIENTDLYPFIKLIDHKKADSIMVGHLHYPNVDTQIASMSYFWLTDYLRGRLQFDGIIFSDDFGMFAASSLTATQLDSCKAFFNAGGDVALLCNEFAEIDHTLDYFNERIFKQNSLFNSRWQRFKSALL
ncbi:beta-N-acetylhexosaminidase [Fastidiosibacter lacustris]|uniref:beta-N-acetylhexosaminidase n=1 Tax=Fastidiosibacter lacustris TaxID=2056695 RepID=UPI000E3437F6|nr:beta-N-acetylhexosaminidase [Fastidiosibacter lacustris]